MNIGMVIPVKNGEAFLKRCLQSVCAQTFKDWVCVVVDDHSTDRTAKVAGEVKDNRIHVINSTNNGVVYARQAGFEYLKSKGIDYVFYLDADDTLPMGALDALVQTAINTQADMIIGDFREVSVGSDRLCKYGDKTITTGEELCRWICEQKVGYMWGKLIKRELMDSVQLLPYGMTFCEDLIIMLQLSANAAGIAHCGHPVYNYCRTDNSVTNRCLTRTTLNSRYEMMTLYLSKVSDLYNGKNEIKNFISSLFIHYLAHYKLSSTDISPKYMGLIQKGLVVLFRKMDNKKILNCNKLAILIAILLPKVGRKRYYNKLVNSGLVI